MARALSIYNLCSKSSADAIAFGKQIIKKISISYYFSERNGKKY